MLIVKIERIFVNMEVIMDKIRIGVFGGGRGSNFYDCIMQNNGEIVAVCDKKEERLEKAKEKLGDSVALYKSFDEFINHPMDAVLVANYFHEHAEYAIRLLEKNIHVLSECTSNSTMADGVRLVRAAEKSKAIYMLCENYPFMLFNQEIKKVYESGSLGKVLYAEGEYNHPGDPTSTANKKDLFDDVNHWRNTLPRTYYITHSLAPIMRATGSMPVRVTALPVFCPPGPEACTASTVGDKLAVISCLNDDDSVFRVFGHATFGGHENSYRVCGTKGQIENLRGFTDTVSILYNEWNIPEGMESRHTSYQVEVPEHEVAFVKEAGHGGGDYYVIKHFFECIRTNTKPDMDVYFATRLASVAILGHKSVMAGGAPFDIPDFRKEEDRIKYENDNASPFWYSDGREPNIPSCSRPDYKATEEQIERFKKALE